MKGKVRTRPFVPRGYCIIGFDAETGKHVGLSYYRGYYGVDNTYTKVFSAAQSLNSFRYPSFFKANEKSWHDKDVDYMAWYDKNGKVRKTKVNGENQRVWLNVKHELEHLKRTGFHSEYDWHAYRIGSRKCPVKIFTREARNLIITAAYDEFLANNYCFTEK